MDLVTLIQFIFDEGADRYERDITPVLAPLAADLVAYAAPRPTDLALEVGPGTGVGARCLAPYVRAVAGLDLSAGILRAARQVPTRSNIAYVQGSIHDPPFGAGTFSLVVSSFSLNATDPARSLRVIRRLLRPGGRLALQEWGPIQPVDQAVSAALADHLVEEPGARVMALREAFDHNPSGWEALQDAYDYREWLADMGFTVEEATECAPVAIRLASAEQYLSFKLAWTYRFEEIQVMDEATRAAFYADARARLADLAAPDGSITWQPVLFRARARV